jgi:phage repressor protein C with HTH and peptisase S24 domain
MPFVTWKDVSAQLSTLGRGSTARLADHLEMDRSYVSRLLKGDQPLTVPQLNGVVTFFENNPNGQGTTPINTKRESQSRTRLPVYGYAAAGGEDNFVFNEGEIIDWLDLPMGLALGPGEYIVVIPYGSSMEPRIFPGEPQVVRLNFPPARDKKAVIEFNNGTAVIKNYRGQRDGRVFAEQFNPPKTLDWDATTVKAIHAVAFGL